MLINRLLMACKRRHFEAGHRPELLNDDVTLTQQFDRKSVQPVQKHVNKREQRVIPEQNAVTS